MIANVSSQIKPRVDHVVQPRLDPRWNAALAPYRQPLVRMKIKCSCGNTFGMAYPLLDLPMVDFQRFTKPARPGVATRSWAQADLIDGLEFVEGGRIRLTCSSKCTRGNPRKWVFDHDRLAGSFVRAARAGRTDLVFGDNL
jgi:hypothetical protein